MQVEFYCRNMLSIGTIVDLSEKGMFINTEEMCFPPDWQLEVAIPFEEKQLLVAVDIKRIIMTPSSKNGVGVELLSPSVEYLKLVDNLRAVGKS